MVRAVIVGVCAAAGVILIGTASENDAKDDPPIPARSGEHGASELKEPDIGDLPAAEDATRAFMRGYLALIAGRGDVRPGGLRAASDELIADLKRNAPRVPAAQEGKRFEVASVAVTFAETRQAASATVQVASPDTATFVMTLRLERAGRAWEVVRLRA